ncbi:MAG: tRNA pseudouridine(55) synthase TruB [Candidatus Sericytochromatia bacterium]|nr:tRNA pseudouridine(55) synthase TruB [Candidatus Sericytochromatia bacterium]
MTELPPFGMLSLLKPPGMTAHDVVGVVRRRLRHRQVGHSGTLDPAAAGVTVVAVGKATRLLRFLRGGKRYRAEVLFGLGTDSADLEGHVVERQDASRLNGQALEEAMTAFRGDIRQRPPMTSAVHVNGKRLYELARAGQTLAPEAIPERRVTIETLDLLSFEPGAIARAHLDVACSAGTYIRSLAVDIGAAVGLPACLGFLLRTEAGDAHLGTAQTLEAFEEAPRWLPQETWLGHMPALTIDAAAVEDIRHGRRINGHLPGEGRLLDPEGQLVAIAAPQDDQLQPLLVL